MPNLVKKGLGSAMRTGSFRPLQRYPKTTRVHVVHVPIQGLLGTPKKPYLNAKMLPKNRPSVSQALKLPT